MYSPGGSWDGGGRAWGHLQPDSNPPSGRLALSHGDPAPHTNTLTLPLTTLQLTLHSSLAPATTCSPGREPAPSPGAHADTLGWAQAPSKVISRNLLCPPLGSPGGSAHSDTCSAPGPTGQFPVPSTGTTSSSSGILGDTNLHEAQPLCGPHPREPPAHAPLPTYSWQDPVFGAEVLCQLPAPHNRPALE